MNVNGDLKVDGLDDAYNQLERGSQPDRCLSSFLINCLSHEYCQQTLLFFSLLNFTFQEWVKGFIVRDFHVDLAAFDDYFFFNFLVYIWTILACHYMIGQHKNYVYAGHNLYVLFYLVVLLIPFISFYILAAIVMLFKETPSYYILSIFRAHLYASGPQAIFQHFLIHDNYGYIMLLSFLPWLDPLLFYLFLDYQASSNDIKSMVKAQIISDATPLVAVSLYLFYRYRFNFSSKLSLFCNYIRFKSIIKVLFNLFSNTVCGISFEFLRYLAEQKIAKTQHPALFYLSRISLLISVIPIAFNLDFIKRAVHGAAAVGVRSPEDMYQERVSTLKSLFKYIISMAFTASCVAFISISLIPRSVFSSSSQDYSSDGLLNQSDSDYLTQPIESSTFIFFGVFELLKGLSLLLISFFYNNFSSRVICCAQEIPLLFILTLLSLFSLLIGFFAIRSDATINEFFHPLIFDLALFDGLALLYAFHVVYNIFDLMKIFCSSVTARAHSISRFLSHLVRYGCYPKEERAAINVSSGI